MYYSNHWRYQFCVGITKKVLQFYEDEFFLFSENTLVRWKFPIFSCYTSKRFFAGGIRNICQNFQQFILCCVFVLFCWVFLLLDFCWFPWLPTLAMGQKTLLTHRSTFVFRLQYLIVILVFSVLTKFLAMYFTLPKQPN